MIESKVEAQALIRFSNIAKSYGIGSASVRAIEGVSGCITPGMQLALVGPSGSGKTTLLHILGGLEIPSSGSIEWPFLSPGERLRPASVGIVFQAPSLLPPLDVLENVALPLLLAGVRQEQALVRAALALEMLDLAQLSEKLPEELSGGQAQRVAISRVLALKPRIILADEPTGQLDQANASKVIDLLIQVATATNAALIVNTHDLAVAHKFSEIWQLKDGIIVSSEVTN
jgi:ABC-type lipoprotein export system ATPase subunit